MKYFLSVIVFVTCLRSFAQQNPAVLSFIAIPGQSDITLSWTIAANSNCSGELKLEHSTDSFFFTDPPIYTATLNASIYDLSFTFTHNVTDKSVKHYYRLIIGSCGYSSIVGANAGASLNYKLYPNPFREQATIIFQNPSNYAVNMYVFDRNGQMVKKSVAFQGNTFEFYREGLPAGLYYFAIATLSDLLAFGRFYVTDF